MIVAVVEAVTVLVVIVKVEAVLPVGTMTLGGTVAEELLLDSAIEIPPVGAAALRVTVLVDMLPPVTEVGLSEMEESATAGMMVSDVVLSTPL